MPQGIRRTTLQQARTEDPFEALLKVDANRVDRRFRSGESELAREFKQGMFDEEMILNRDKFAETQMQNAASRANAAARLGLAKSAHARAGKLSSGKMTPLQYEMFKRKNEMFRLEHGLKKNYLKDKSGSGGKGNFGPKDALAIPGELSDSERMNIANATVAAREQGYTSNEIENAAYGSVKGRGGWGYIPFVDDHSYDASAFSNLLPDK